MIWAEICWLDCEDLECAIVLNIKAYQKKDFFVFRGLITPLPPLDFSAFLRALLRGGQSFLFRGGHEEIAKKCPENGLK